MPESGGAQVIDSGAPSAADVNEFPTVFSPWKEPPVLSPSHSADRSISLQSRPISLLADSPMER